MSVAVARPTVPPTLDLGAVPDPLRAGKRFVGWRFEERRGEPKPAKVPYSPTTLKKASSTATADWVTFDMAARYAQVAGLDGIMRAFDHADGHVGIDLDNCLDPSVQEPGIDDLDEWAAEYVRRLDTYTEVSPSRTGVKLWAKGTMPAFGHKRGDVEMYGSTTGSVGPCGRFFTLTGQHLNGTPREVAYRPDAILAIHREVFGDAPDPAATLDSDRPVPALQLGDEEVIRLASESPHNGARFRRLWSGDTSAYAADGNDGASEADGALCELLAYYGGPDPDRIKRLFPRSGLYREKWDRVDYQDRTIALALKGKTRFYGDGMQAPKGAGSDGATVCVCADCPAVAEVGRLRRLALDRDDQLEELETLVRTQRERLAEVLARIDGWKAVLSNPKLKPADRIVAIPFIEDVKAAQKIGQAEVHIRYPGIVKGWGIPESTVTKSAAVLTEMAGAPLAKRNNYSVQVFPDRDTGKLIEAPTMATYVKATVEGNLYTAVAGYDPGLPQRGGKRTPLPTCPDHPEADVTVRTVPHCATCRKPIGAAKEKILCRQNEGIGGDGPPPVFERNYCRQNEAIGAPDGLDEVTLARRAQEAVDVQTRPPDRWKQPDSPVPAPNGHGESLGRIPMTRSRPCPECPTKEPHYPIMDGETRCPDCGHVERESAAAAEVAG